MPRRLPAALTSLIVWAVLGPAAALAQTATPQVPPATKPVFEEWMLISLGGKTCGFGSTITTSELTPQGLHYTTELQEEFVAKRLGTALKLSEVSHVTEDAKGVVLSFDQLSTGMGSNIEERGERKGDTLIVSSRGQTARYHLPALAALGPEAIRRQTDAVPLRAGTRFSLNTFLTDYPRAVAVEEGLVVGREAHVSNGVTRQLWKITSQMPVMKGINSVTWVDDHNNDVENDVEIPGLGEMRQIVSDRATCMKQPEGAEIFAGSLIAPQIPLTDLAHLRQADYRITTGDGQKLNLWNTGEQHMLKSSRGATEIEVTVPDWKPSDATYRLPCPRTPALQKYLQPSAYLESASPYLVLLAHEAVGKETNPVLAAFRIEKYVEAYITKKDLNIGFASAEETAHSAEGDCTEHAVLCAALGRALGLPTRCVLGLGYIPPGEMEPTISNTVDTKTGIFGFHMWAEAYIGNGHWTAMDAALGSFDVGHIAIFKSALDDIDPMVDLNMPILSLMQNLHITVLKTVPMGPPVPVLAPALAAPILRAPSTLPAATASPRPPATPPLPSVFD